MRKKIVILPIALIAALVLADREPPRVAYALSGSNIPVSIRAYAEENPESFVTNMNDLMGQGYSELEALLEMERRLKSNLDKIKEEQEHARFLKEVEAIPFIERAGVLKNPDSYQAAKRKLASGTSVSPAEEKQLGIMKGKGGVYQPISKAHPHHLHHELAYANLMILYDQTVNEIQGMMQWLRINGPPRDIPVLNSEYTDEEKRLDVRRQLALAERDRIGIDYIFQKQLVDERAAVQRRLKKIEAQLSSIQKRLTKIEENQHWH